MKGARVGNVREWKLLNERLGVGRRGEGEMMLDLRI